MPWGLKGVPQNAGVGLGLAGLAMLGLLVGLVLGASVSSAAGSGLEGASGGTGVPLWSWDEDLSRSQIAVGPGTLYVAQEGNLTAFDPEDREVRWRVQGPPGGGLVLGADGDNVYTLTPKDEPVIEAWSNEMGEITWNRTFPTIQIGDFRLSDGVLILSDVRDEVVGLDTATGQEDFRFSTDHIDGPFTYANGVVYTTAASTIDPMVKAVDTTSTRTLWETELPAVSIQPPRVEGGTVTIMDFNGTLHGIDAADGSERWSVDGPDRMDEPPLVGDGTAVLLGFGGEVVTLDVATGERLWEARSTAIEPRGTIANGTVYVVDADGAVQAWNAEDGTALWRVRTGGEPRGPPWWSADVAILGTRGDPDRLVALDAGTGTTPGSADDVSLEDLHLRPQTAAPGEPVASAATVANTGPTDAYARIQVLVDGELHDAETRAVEAESRTVLQLEPVTVNTTGPHEVTVRLASGQALTAEFVAAPPGQASGPRDTDPEIEPALIEGPQATWSRPLGDRASEPALAGDVAVVDTGASSQGVVAIERTTGRDLWTLDVARAKLLEDRVLDRVLVVGGELQAVNVSTGEPAWVRPGALEPRHDPVRVGDDLLVRAGLFEEQLRRIDARTGAAFWTVALEDLRDVHVSGDRVILEHDERLVGRDRATGDVVWTHPTRGGFGSPDVRMDGDRVVLLERGTLTVLDTRGGERIMHREMPDRAVADVHLAGSSLVLETGQGNLTVVEPDTGEVTWTEASVGRAATLGDRVIVLGHDGSVRARSATTGELLWNRSLDRQRASQLLASEHGIVIGGQDGHLTVLDPPSGDERMTTLLAGQIIPRGIDERAVYAIERRDTDLSFPVTKQQPPDLTEPRTRLVLLDASTGHPIASHPLESPYGPALWIKGGTAFLANQEGHPNRTLVAMPSDTSPTARIETLDTSPGSVETEQTAGIHAHVHNPSPVTTYVRPWLTIDGDPHPARRIKIAPGTTERVLLSTYAPHDPGDHRLAAGIGEVGEAHAEAELGAVEAAGDRQDWGMPSGTPARTHSVGTDPVSSTFEPWRRDVGWDPKPPAVADGRVHLLDDEQLLTIRADRGDTLWRTELDAFSSPAPVVENGIVLVGRRHFPTALEARDAASGEVAWTWTPPGPTLQAVVSEQGVAFAIARSQITALEANSGERLWTTRLGAPVTEAPIVSEGSLVLPTHGGSVQILDTHTGERTGRIDLDDELGGPPTLADGVLLVPVGEPPNVTTLRAYDATDHALIWERTLDDDVRPDVSVSGSLAVIADSSGTVQALELGTGEPVWSTATQASEPTPVAIADDRVHVLGREGELATLDLASGEELEDRTLAGTFQLAPVVADDVLYAVNEDGNVLARAVGAPADTADAPPPPVWLALALLATTAVIARSRR